MAPLELPVLHHAENWFFDASGASVLPVALSAWLIWQRGTALRTFPITTGIALVLLFSGAGTLLFAGAYLVHAADLLAPSLALYLLGTAALFRGAAGCRRMLLPAVVLCSVVSIPAPLRNEVIWSLQNATTSAAGQLLLATGHTQVAWSGILMHVDDHDFVVIESCSGLRGIELLMLVALIVRELFEG